jgi:hypothetical protein
MPCTHRDQIVFTEPSDPVEGCVECLRIGSDWVHLRMCQSCGKVGCCDSSPNQHASKRARRGIRFCARSSRARTGAGA